MASRSAREGLAVPMSRPRYTWPESMLTISTGRRSASSKARRDLPLAVGPSRHTAVFAALLAATQEQAVEVGHRELVPGRATMVAAAGPLGLLHFAQQRVHLG